MLLGEGQQQDAQPGNKKVEGCNVGHPAGIGQLHHVPEQQLVDPEIGVEHILGQGQQSDQADQRRGSGTPQLRAASLFGLGQQEKGEAEKQEADGRVRLHGDAPGQNGGQESHIPKPSEQHQASQEH